MDLTPYVDDLQRRLSTAADAGGENARQLAQRLTVPLDAAVRLVLLDALSAAAGEISAELAPGSVDVRLRGGEPEFVVAAPVAAPVGTPVTPVGAAEPTDVLAIASTPVADAEGGASTRTTLRLPDHLKARAEVAAARDGISVNTWLVRAVAAALDRPADRSTTRAGAEQSSSHRLTGWVH